VASTTSRRKFDVVASGHASKGGPSILAEDGEDGKPGTILKQLDKIEYEVYDRLHKVYKDDAIHGVVPEFGGVVDAHDDDGKPVRLIRIANVLHDFYSPKVMDVKIGLRTFLESECKNKKLRPDLFERMEEMYPAELTDMERAAKAITKHRWMTVRDKSTTISSLGYRIDGIAGFRRMSQDEMDKQLQEVTTREDAAKVFQQFAEVAATDDFNQVDGHTQLFVAERIRQRLCDLHTALNKSRFVKGHEFIGSSILICADAYGHFGVSWIDFAKTQEVEKEITHRDPWEMGNREDGIIFGVEQLIETWDEAVRGLRSVDTLGLASTVVVVNGKAKVSLTPPAPPPRAGTESTAEDVLLLSSLPVFSGLLKRPSRPERRSLAMFDAELACEEQDEEQYMEKPADRPGKPSQGYVQKDPDIDTACFAVARSLHGEPEHRESQGDDRILARISL
jgi:1D-myo-inositol-triphosphate 3-kinase